MEEKTYAYLKDLDGGRPWVYWDPDPDGDPDEEIEVLIGPDLERERPPHCRRIVRQEIDAWIRNGKERRGRGSPTEISESEALRLRERWGPVE